MRKVIDLNLPATSPTYLKWVPIFYAAAIHGEDVMATPNVGGCWTLLIPSSAMPYIRTGEIKVPATQAFNERYLIFA